MKTSLLSIIVLENPSLANYPLDNIADVSLCKTEQQVLRKLSKGKYHAVVCGLERGRIPRKQFLSRLQTGYPDVAVVIAVSRARHVRASLLALISGASGLLYLSPCSENRVSSQLQTAIRRNHVNRIVDRGYAALQVRKKA